MKLRSYLVRDFYFNTVHKIIIHGNTVIYYYITNSNATNELIL